MSMYSGFPGAILLPNGPLAIPMTQCFLRLVIDTHISNAQRLMGLVDFFLPDDLPFFGVGAVDGGGIAVNALLDVATGAAGAAAFFLFFVHAVVGGMASIGGRAGATMMTSILLLAGDSNVQGAAEAVAIMELGGALPLALGR